MDMATSTSSSLCGSADCSSVARLIAHACELNEDGVYELSSGRSMEAVLHFQQAWDSLLQAYETADTNGSLCRSNSNYHTVTNRLQIPHLHDDLFYIYSCAVAYAPPPRHQDTICHTMVLFQCAIVLFNMALAYHQHGKKVQREAFLRTALSYYQDCYQALQSLLNATADNENDDLILLTLAVMNNQAHIEYELQDDRGVNTPGESFQKLWQYSLHYALIADEQSTNFSKVEQSQIHEFVQNALVFRMPRPCAAPTA